jgi:ATP-binding cassette subfamily B protein/subfamily B ATP-binding cassette protein MsbA
VTLFLRSLRYLKPYTKLAVLSGVLIVLGAMVGLLGPWPFSLIIDSVITQGRPLPSWLSFLDSWTGGSGFALIVLFAMAGFLIAVVGNALTVVDSYVNTRIDQSMTLDFRSELFQHVERLSLATHDQRRSGMLIYCINSLADGVPKMVMAIPPLAQSFLTLIGMLGVALWIDWRLALISIVVVPFLYYSVGYYMKYIQPRLYNVKQLEGESLAIIHEAISMLRVIIAFNRESYEYRRFRTQGERAIDARIRLTVRQTIFSLGVNTITALGTALVLGAGANDVLKGRLRLGELTVILAYIAAIYRPLETISNTIGGLQDAVVNLRIAFGVLDQVPDIRDAPRALRLGRARGHVTYKHVGFSYTGRVDTLRDISFEAEPGHVVALVGPTGAGKTTLVSLLPRFYDALEGQILLDHQDIRRYTLASLREQVSIVLQEPLLFSGSIADNIRYGKLDASLEAVMEAARSANAHDFIMELPQQYDTELGERGAKLSGGERQRIAVARAFIKNAPILILDEPTSSIDSKTEAVILDALDRLMVGRTTFMIAHRLSTLRRADAILVMDHGQLVERGTHEELLARRGLYKQLFDMQIRQNGRKHAHEPPAGLEPTAEVPT